MEKHLILKKAMDFPQAFKLLPIADGKPSVPGTWAAYPHDEVTILWINSSHQEALSFYKWQLNFNEVKEMTKALTNQEEGNLQTLLKNNMRAITSVLPQHLTPEKAARLLFGVLVRNPALGRCTQSSIMNCFLESSTLGLEIGGPLHHASLIPFKNQATLVIEYNGKIMLANNTGNVKNVSAYAVYEKDDFNYHLGLNPDIHHIPSNDKDPGKIVYAYAVINYLNGGQDFEVITEKIAMEAKERSAAKDSNSSPWNQKDMEYQQWKKTAIHRLMNRVPKSAEKLGQAPMDGYIPDRLSSFDLEEMPTVQIPKDTNQKPAQKTAPKKEKSKSTKKESSKNAGPELKKALAADKAFPGKFKKAMQEKGFKIPTNQLTENQSKLVCKELNRIVDSDNG